MVSECFNSKLRHTQFSATLGKFLPLVPFSYLMKQLNDLTFYDDMAAEWWSESAKIYALNRLNSPRFEYFDRHIPSWQGLSVLDVGCGGGFTCEFLAARGAIVTGIDQSAKCIAAAKAHAAEQYPAIVYKQAYAESIPADDQSFDVVVCVDVLEHVADLTQTLREIHRVLKPGGIFCFDTINRTFKSKLIMIWLLEDIMKEISAGVHDWRKFIKPSELTDSLQQLGFVDVEIKGFNLFGETPAQSLATLWHYRKTGGFRISISDNSSVIYIGKAQKI